tara:strand:- start:4251 stop:7916 length:3666 start_codon:yes stop_codon:yes gene_type:complete
MTYRENVKNLLARENINLRRISDNTQTKINEIDKKKKETIDNIGKATELLIGGGKLSAGDIFQRGRDKKELTGEGILPYLYGRHVRGKDIEGKEAFEADRKEQLEQLALLQKQLKGLKDIDTAHHEAKYQLLLNGGYYEDADRFAQLSPHAQVAYAKEKLNLHHTTVKDSLSLWMSKDETQLDVNGFKYTPKSVTGIPLAPIALKEHALNVGLDTIRHQRGIDGFNPKFLELMGTSDLEKKAKKELLNKYREQYGIESSYNTRLKIIKEFMNDNEYDFNRVISYFKGTKGTNGELLHPAGAWDEAGKLVVSMGVGGGLPEGFFDRLRNSIDPLTGLRYGDDPSKEARFLNWEAEIEFKRNQIAKRMALKDENARNKLEEKFNEHVKSLETGKYLSENDLAFYQLKYLEYGGTGWAPWLMDYHTVQDRNDDEDKEYLINLYKRRGGDGRGGYLIPKDFWGMNPAVYKWAMSQDDNDETSGLLLKSNENGYSTGEQLLKEGGDGSVLGDIIEHVNIGLQQSGWEKPEKYPWRQAAIEKAKDVFRMSYYKYSSSGQYATQQEAINAAMNDVEAAIFSKGLTVGPFKIGSPVNTSNIFKREVPTDKELKERTKTLETATEFIKEGLVENGDSNFLSTKEGLITSLGKEPILDAIKYLRGEIPVPKIYADLAAGITGMTGDKLARMQLTAALAADPDLAEEHNIKKVDIDNLLVDSNEPNAWGALDLPQHRDIANSFGYKSSPFSKCQTRACIDDKLYKLRKGIINKEEFKEGEIETPTTNQQQEASLQRDKLGNINVASGEKSDTEAAVGQLEANIKRTQQREGEEETLVGLIKERLKGADLEEQIRASTSLPKDKEIMEKYFGGTDRNAQLRYTLAQQLGLLNEYPTSGEVGLIEEATGVKQDISNLQPREVDYEAANEQVNELILSKVNPTAVEKNFPLTGDYKTDMEYSWVKEKIESGEWQIVPTLDGKDITAEQALGRYTEPKPLDIPQIGSFLGSEYLLGIPWSQPNIDQVDYRIITPEAAETNQLSSSVFTVPGSPYLNDNLQQYAGQLVAMNVGQDPTLPATLEEATTDLDKWNWVVNQARQAGAKYPELIAAQFMLESGRGANVSGTHNYFGLKTTATDPDSTWLETSEFKNGKWVKVMAPFKNFDSPEAAIKYLSKLWYKDFGAYKGANNGKDINSAIQVLVDGDYATDPDYAKKLLKLLQEFEKLKSKPKKPITV